METAQRRRVDTDFLRTIGAFFVIMIHISASNPGTISSVFYNAISRFSVPVFVMISGQYMLAKQQSYARVVRKSLKLFGVLLFWSSIYTLMDVFVFGQIFEDWKSVISYILLNPVHFWYLYAAITLYLLTPFLIVFCKHAAEADLLYFMGLTFSLGSVVWTVLKISPCGLLAQIIEKMKVSTMVGFVFCYVFGYYIATYKMKKHHRNLAYGFGVLGVFVTFGGTLFLWHVSGELNDLLFSFFAPNVILTSMAVFILLKTVEWKPSPKVERWIHILAECSFGIYLLHSLLLHLLVEGFRFLFVLPAVAAIPLETSLLFSITAVVVYMLKKIPWLKNLL